MMNKDFNEGCWDYYEDDVDSKNAQQNLTPGQCNHCGKKEEGIQYYCQDCCQFFMEQRKQQRVNNQKQHGKHK